MPRLIEAFWRDRLGAISPMYAMALIALIAIAGVGFDYGRLMAMHTELQNAADQAALAAATQLDGRTDAIERARAAATATFATATSGFVNKTRISTDAEGRPVTRLTFTFFDGYGEPDGFARDRTGNETEVGTDAKVVRVVVDDRGVRYALTPIVDAVYGSVPASAMAMLRRAACRVPSMLVCIDRTDFDLPALKGKALRMRWKSSADVTPLAPGNFGFLLSDKETESNVELGMSEPDQCISLDDVKTEPGFRSKESAALNTRFDWPLQDPGKKLECDPDTGDFCPAEGVRKDYAVSLDKQKLTSPNETLGLADVRAAYTCPASVDPKLAWHSFADLADVTGAIVERTDGDSFRLDTCFFGINPDCSYLGDGVWNVDEYLALHHPGKPASDFPAPVTRYSVYKWELADKSARLPSRVIGFVPDKKPVPTGGGFAHTITAFCTYARPVFSPPVVPSSLHRDRRVMTVAAAKCTGLAGRKNVTILGWMDIFLLAPATSEDPGTIRAEVLNPARGPGDVSGFQYFGHDRAVLIR